MDGLKSLDPRKISIIILIFSDWFFYRTNVTTSMLCQLSRIIKTVLRRNFKMVKRSAICIRWMIFKTEEIENQYRFPNSSDACVPKLIKGKQVGISLSSPLLPWDRCWGNASLFFKQYFRISFNILVSPRQSSFQVENYNKF